MNMSLTAFNELKMNQIILTKCMDTPEIKKILVIFHVALCSNSRSID